VTGPLDLLVLGEGNVDLVLSGGDVEPAFGQVEKLVERAQLTIGSSGAILACGAARLGLRTALVCAVGDDAFGAFFLERVAARGVDVSGCRRDPTVDTGVTVHMVRGSDRAMLTAPGSIDVLCGDDVDEAQLAAARHVHVASYYLQRGLQPAVPELLRRARAGGATTSIDPGWDSTGRWDSGLDAALRETDLLLVNRPEAEGVGCRVDEVPSCAIKLGGAGARLRRGSEEAQVEAPAVEVVDAIGAGDSFGAGLICALLDGRPTGEALRLAVACGSLSTRGAGGTDRQPTLAEAEALAAELSETDRVGGA
jgi:sugar/nucleoside kinase (ribokinase family)